MLDGQLGNNLGHRAAGSLGPMKRPGPASQPFGIPIQGTAPSGSTNGLRMANVSAPAPRRRSRLGRGGTSGYEGLTCERSARDPTSWTKRRAWRRLVSATTWASDVCSSMFASTRGRIFRR
jgi:hypothetical protein